MVQCQDSREVWIPLGALFVILGCHFQPLGKPRTSIITNFDLDHHNFSSCNRSPAVALTSHLAPPTQSKPRLALISLPPSRSHLARARPSLLAHSRITILRLSPPCLLFWSQWSFTLNVGGLCTLWSALEMLTDDRPVQSGGIADTQTEQPSFRTRSIQGGIQLA